MPGAFGWLGSMVTVPSDPLLVSRLSGCWWGYRPYVENYTVDASILDSCRLNHLGSSSD